jgi:hypothetical protein
MYEIEEDFCSINIPRRVLPITPLGYSYTQEASQIISSLNVFFEIKKLLTCYRGHYIYLAKIDMGVSNYNIVVSNNELEEGKVLQDIECLTYESSSSYIKEFINFNFPELIYV